MDFTTDTLAAGRNFRPLNIVDDFTRECVAIEVDRSLPGLRVTRALDRLRATIGLPQTIVMDNGRRIRQPRHGRLGIRPRHSARIHSTGKPVENAFIESFRKLPRSIDSRG